MGRDIKFTKERFDGGNPQEVKEFLIKHWGSPFIVSKGKITDATKITRIVARDGNKLVGLITYAVDEKDKSCEVISIDCEVQGKGIGTRLIEIVEKIAKEKECRRVWVITTNDNLDAAKFYLKRGYRLIAVHLNALDASRKLKPQIPKIGKNGIQLNDEWEFEKI